MKIALWIYALVGMSYFMRYYIGEDPHVMRFAVGPLWLLMMLAPVVLAGLVCWPLTRKFWLQR